MSKKIMSLLLACGIGVSGITAYASPSFLSRFSPETGEVTLIGEANRNVTIRIADSDVPDGAFSEQNLPLVIDRIYAEGDFNYSLILPDSTPAGKYNVYLRDSEGIAEGSFQFFDAENANENIIPAVNQAKDDGNYEEYVQTIMSSADNLGIDKEDSLYKEKISYMAELLYNTFDSFTDVTDFCNKYYYIYAIASIAGADAQKADDVMKKFEADLGINYENDYLSDTKLTDKTRASLCEMLSSYDFEEALHDGKTFSDILESLKPMASITNASKWQDIEKAMEQDYKDEFKFIFDENYDYKSVVNMREVYSYMMESISRSATYNDIQRLFDTAVETVLSAGSGYGSNSSGSSGGGGGGGGFSSVVMPKDDAEIPTQSTPAIPQAQSYTDVDSQFWASEAISALSLEKSINGYDDGSFKPNNLITRAEFIKILVSIIGYEPAECEFTDVSSDKWYYGYVGAASKLGIAKGNEGLFNPESSVTRQDGATLLFRALSDGAAGTEYVTFTDEAEIADYAYDAVKTLSSLGVLNGYTSGEFIPSGNMTRAEVAQMLYKAKKGGLLKQTGGK